MSSTATARIIANIDAKLKGNMQAKASSAFNLIPSAVKDGKLYEAHVLAEVAEQLVTQENLSLQLVNGNSVYLKSGTGPINRAYPYIKAFRKGQLIGELWTDVSFRTLSHNKRGGPQPLTQGDFHELDLVLTTPGATGYPTHEEVLLAVECKCTSYSKRLLRELLGVRRELSYLQGSPVPTAFSVWPCAHLPVHPASCLLAYCTDNAVLNFAAPGTIHGIQFIHHPM